MCQASCQLPIPGLAVIMCLVWPAAPALQSNGPGSARTLPNDLTSSCGCRCYAVDEGRLLQSLRQHKDIVTCIAVGLFILNQCIETLQQLTLLAMACFLVPGLPVSQVASYAPQGAASLLSSPCFLLLVHFFPQSHFNARIHSAHCMLPDVQSSPGLAKHWVATALFFACAKLPMPDLALHTCAEVVCPAAHPHTMPAGGH